jgi:hypothetical protein
MVTVATELWLQTFQGAQKMLDTAYKNYINQELPTGPNTWQDRIALQEGARRAYEQAVKYYEYVSGLGQSSPAGQIAGVSQPANTQSAKDAATAAAAGQTLVTTENRIGTAAGPEIKETSSGRVIQPSGAQPSSAQLSPTSPTMQMPFRVPETIPGAQQINIGLVAMEAARKPNATPEEVQRAVTLEASGFNKTVLVPYGERTLTAVGRAKYAVDPVSGELAIYQVPIDPYTGKPRTGIYGAESGGILIGGAGRYGLQSGMFFEARPGMPLPTPDIREQYNPSKYSKYADVASADYLRARPEMFSRLGAEAYYGRVMPLDSRKLTPDARMSVYPRESGNLANIVYPWGANVPKGAYAGSNIPWSVSMGAPSRQYMFGQEGFVGEAPSPFSVGPSQSEIKGVVLATGMSFEPFAAPTKQATLKETATQSIPPEILVRAPDGTMQPDYMVPFGNVTAQDRIRGTKKVASVATDITTGESFSSGIPSKVIEPTGTIDIPFFGTYTPPEPIRNIIKFFQPGYLVTGKIASTYEVAPEKTGGIDYARSFIGPTGEKTKTLEYAVGAPTTTTSVLPTGETIETTTQNYETFTIPEKVTMVVPEVKQLKSGYETFLDREFRSRVPSKEVGERTLAQIEMTMPIIGPQRMAREASAVVAERLLVATGAPKTTIEGARTAHEMATSITSPTAGQYEMFVDRPEMSVASFGLMAVTGGATRGIVSVASKSGEVMQYAPVVEKAMPLVNVGLGALYGGVVSYEETKGFTKVTPETVARVKARATQEGIPGALGFGAGYKAPELILGEKVVVTGGDYEIDARRIASGGLFETGRPLIDPKQTASGGLLPSEGKWIVKSQYVTRVGGLLGEGGVTQRIATGARGIPSKVSSAFEYTPYAAPKEYPTEIVGGVAKPSQKMQFEFGEFRAAAKYEPGLEFRGGAIVEKRVPTYTEASATPKELTTEQKLAELTAMQKAEGKAEKLKELADLVLQSRFYSVGAAKPSRASPVSKPPREVSEGKWVKEAGKMRFRRTPVQSSEEYYGEVPTAQAMENVQSYRDIGSLTTVIEYPQSRVMERPYQQTRRLEFNMDVLQVRPAISRPFTQTSVVSPRTQMVPAIAPRAGAYDFSRAFDRAYITSKSEASTLSSARTSSISQSRGMDMLRTRGDILTIPTAKPAILSRVQPAVQARSSAFADDRVSSRTTARPYVRSTSMDMPLVRDTTMSRSSYFIDTTRWITPRVQTAPPLTSGGGGGGSGGGAGGFPFSFSNRYLAGQGIGDIISSRRATPRRGRARF